MARKSKKRRTAKQKAASRRNIKKAQKKSRTRKRARSRKSNKQRRSRPRSMPKKKRRSSGGKKSFIDKIPILRNKTVQKVGFGLGMGVIAADIIGLAARFGPPQISDPLVKNQNIIKLGVELATEPLSALVDVALNPGQLKGITGRLGMNSNNGSQAVTGGNMQGFA